MLRTSREIERQAVPVVALWDEPVEMLSTSVLLERAERLEGLCALLRREEDPGRVAAGDPAALRIAFRLEDVGRLLDEVEDELGRRGEDG